MVIITNDTGSDVSPNRTSYSFRDHGVGKTVKFFLQKKISHNIRNLKQFFLYKIFFL